MIGAPKVSVIVPCYNLGQFLDETIDSVLEQTYQDFEILIVDDGSTEPATLRALEHFARPKTTLFRTENQGLAKARNFLIAHAKGEYLCALDADDVLHRDFLEKTVRVLDSEPSLTFVSTHLEMFGLDNQRWPPDPRCDLASLLAEDTVITAALVRRAAVLAVGGYDEGMPHQGDEDWDLWLSLVASGYRGRILPDVLFFYRRREHSMSTECSIGAVHIDLMRYLVRKHGDHYRAHLVEVLLWNEREISELRRANMQLEAESASSLAPTLERRRLEVQHLRDRLVEVQRRRRLEEQADDPGTPAAGVASIANVLGGHRRELEALDAEYERCLAEVEALRTSLSWRLTAPLRAPLDLVRGLRRRLDHD